MHQSSSRAWQATWALRDQKPFRVYWPCLFMVLLLGVLPDLAAAEHGADHTTEPPINPALVGSQSLIPNSNLVAVVKTNTVSEVARLPLLMEEAARAKANGDLKKAEKLFIQVMQTAGAPVDTQKTALLELAVMAHANKEFAKAQQIYAQFLKTFPEDPSAPEILLRQGLIYREMGVSAMALSKFYAVMSTALHLKSDRLDYYRRLVLHAQSEIADTYYLQGKYEEASDFFQRLLKLDSQELDKAKIHYKLIRSFSLRARYDDVVAQTALYLDRYGEADGTAEVRFLCADALRKLGRSRDAMEQVFALLKLNRTGAPASELAYWQQRTGNELANQLYHEGDYVSAMAIYRALAALNSSPEWQAPALYQVGLVYERLRQTPKAVETYNQILQEQSNLGTNAPSPALVAVLNMAKWRKDFLSWEQGADDATRRINAQPPPLAPPHE
ncbi:MAG: tetratricopeptide repeat protein [Verrucomicrobiota bacterium]